MGVGDDAGSIVNDGYQAGRLIKYSRLGLADSVRSRKDQWTAIHYKAAIGFVNISTTCITAVGHKLPISQLSNHEAQSIFWHLFVKLLCLTAISDKKKPALAFVQRTETP